MKKPILTLTCALTIILFSCKNDGKKGTFTDQRDGKTYKTVRINRQIWMAENLAYLPSVSSPKVGSETKPYYYVYGYEGTNTAEAKATDNYATYGVLYNWAAAMNGAKSSEANPSNVQGVCPNGWHLPSDTEWTGLIDYLGGENIAGNKLKQIGITHWIGSNKGATNESGFTALPGGYRLLGGTFAYIRDNGAWWSSTKYNPDAHNTHPFIPFGVYGIEVDECFHPGTVNRTIGNEEFGKSVRCVKSN